MAFFTDTVYNADTKRHELHFVNQQYDLLMAIYYKDAIGDYWLGDSLEEAQRIYTYWSGRDEAFDVEEWLDVARKELPELDRQRNE